MNNLNSKKLIELIELQNRKLDKIINILNDIDFSIFDNKENRRY